MAELGVGATVLALSHIALAAHATWVKGQKEIAGLMLMSMEPDIQRNLENLGAYDILQKLKTFAQQAEQELLQTVREFHACKQEEGQSVSSYVLKMKSYIDNLESLGHPVSLNVAVSLILVSLRKEYDSFVQNYNMHDMGKMVTELHAMLKLHEQTLPKKDAPTLHAIRACKFSLHLRRKILLRTQSVATAVIHAIGSETVPDIYLSCYRKRIYLRELVLQEIKGSRKLKPGALSLVMRHVSVQPSKLLDLIICVSLVD
ncbi:hypothetical protein Tco_0223007 [Tanacetum coccineum]